MDFKISNQPMQLSKKTSFAGSLFEASFFIVLIIVAYIYLVSPKQEAYTNLKSQRESLVEQQVDLERKKTVFDNLLQILTREQASVALADDMLPLENRPSRLYILLENLTQSASLSSAVITVENNPRVIVAGEVGATGDVFADKRAVEKTSISISATGTMDQLDNLLKLLEISSRVIQVTALEINQGSGDQLIFKIGAESYSYLPEQVSTK